MGYRASRPERFAWPVRSPSGWIAWSACALAMLSGCPGEIDETDGSVRDGQVRDAPVDAPARADAMMDATVLDDGVDVDAAIDGAALDGTELDGAALDGAALDGAAMDARVDDSATADAMPDAATPPLMVDRSNPRLHALEFRPNEADPEARQVLGTQWGGLDTRVAPRGRLVVYLHGAGTPTNCTGGAHTRILAEMGFHVLAPCYVSGYGVDRCGSDIGGCRLEAFEGVDHHTAITIAPPDSIERRVVRGLQFLQRRDPGSDWDYYLDGTRPRWDRIVVSGISHGASTSGLIGLVRPTARVVMLSGPLDTGQAWLRQRPSMTPMDAFYGFSHTGDSQHAGHLRSFGDLGVPGTPYSVDGRSVPYGDSHRLITSATSSNGHSATQAGSASPRDASSNYVYLPVWRWMYGATAP